MIRHKKLQVSHSICLSFSICYFEQFSSLHILQLYKSRLIKSINNINICLQTPPLCTNCVQHPLIILVAASLPKTTRFRFPLQKSIFLGNKKSQYLSAKKTYFCPNKYFLHPQTSGQGENTSRAKIFSQYQCYSALNR